MLIIEIYEELGNIHRPHTVKHDNIVQCSPSMIMSTVNTCRKRTTAFATECVAFHTSQGAVPICGVLDALVNLRSIHGTNSACRGTFRVCTQSGRLSGKNTFQTQLPTIKCLGHTQAQTHSVLCPLQGSQSLRLPTDRSHRGTSCWLSKMHSLWWMLLWCIGRNRHTSMRRLALRITQQLLDSKPNVHNMSTLIR